MLPSRVPSVLIHAYTFGRSFWVLSLRRTVLSSLLFTSQSSPTLSPPTVPIGQTTSYHDVRPKSGPSGPSAFSDPPVTITASPSPADILIAKWLIRAWDIEDTGNNRHPPDTCRIKQRINCILGESTCCRDRYRDPPVQCPLRANSTIPFLVSSGNNPVM